PRANEDGPIDVVETCLAGRAGGREHIEIDDGLVRVRRWENNDTGTQRGVRNHQAHGVHVECQIEELQIEELQIEELQIEELQIEELQIEELQIEELQIEELQIEELRISLPVRKLVHIAARDGLEFADDDTRVTREELCKRQIRQGN